MTYLVLIMFTLVYIYLSIKFVKYDLISPSVITGCVFLLSEISAYIGLLSWNTEPNLNWKLVFIIPLGLFSFLAGEIAIRKYLTNKISQPKLSQITIIKINSKLVYITLGFVIFTIVILLINMFTLTNTNSFSNAINTFRELFMKNGGVYEGKSLNSIVAFLSKVTDVLGFIVIYYISIFAQVFLLSISERKIILRESKTYLTVLLSIFILICFHSFILSGRAYLLRYMIAMFFTTAIFLLKNNKKLSTKQLKKIFIYSICCILVLIILFYTMLPILGRNSNFGFIEYITFYLGSPIPSFSKYLDLGVSNNQIIGAEMFPGIQIMLNKIGFDVTTAYSSLGWTKFGNMTSNVYSGLRRYYNDFGVIGVMVFQFLFSVFINFIYISCISIRNRKLQNLFIVLYGYYIYMIIDQYRDDAFYRYFFSHTNLLYLIIIVGLVMIYYKESEVIYEKY